jgi:hypothetical protein
MKLKLFLFSFIWILFTGCEKEESVPNESQIEIKGVIQEAGITSYQYGTHKIISNGKWYALKSSTINLNSYLDKEVTVWGDKVKGYPVDGGPEFIDVKRLEDK